MATGPVLLMATTDSWVTLGRSGASKDTDVVKLGLGSVVNR